MGSSLSQLARSRRSRRASAEVTKLLSQVGKDPVVEPTSRHTTGPLTLPVPDKGEVLVADQTALPTLTSDPEVVDPIGELQNDTLSNESVCGVDSIFTYRCWC